MNATPFHRLGLALTLSAVWEEAQHLNRELAPYLDGHTDGSDVRVKHDLEEIKKHADRISALCGIEGDKLVERMNRHAVVGE